MTLDIFEDQLKKYIVGVEIKQRHYGDIAGIYIGDTYLFRLSKGDLPLYTWRERISKDTFQKYAEATGRQIYPGRKKRGRMQSLQMLVSMNYLNNTQASEIMWGFV